jgi:hypothetical protein
VARGWRNCRTRSFMNGTLHHILTSRSNKSSHVYPLQRPGGCSSTQLQLCSPPAACTHVREGRADAQVAVSGLGQCGCVCCVRVVLCPVTCSSTSISVQASNQTGVCHCKLTGHVLDSSYGKPPLYQRRILSHQMTTADTSNG